MLRCAHPGLTRRNWRLQSLQALARVNPFVHNIFRKKARGGSCSPTALQKLGRTTAHMLRDVTAAWERQTGGEGEKKSDPKLYLLPPTLLLYSHNSKLLLF